MNIRFGYELVYACPQPTPMLLRLHAHPSRIHDLIRPDNMGLSPNIEATIHHDGFSNTCTRIEAPAGQIRIAADGIIHDSGLPEPVYPFAHEYPVSLLPADTLIYLLGSRYCGTEALMEEALRLFGHRRPGWSRVQAICDVANEHIRFGYHFARPTKTAWDAFTERQGVCRDFVHLAMTFCRCLNIPARYCTGYLSDIGLPASDAPTDFACWFEAYLGGAWHTFDPRNNQRRIGRILVAQGRDAADVAISTTFGPNYLKTFRVWTDDVSDVCPPASASNFLDQRYGHAADVA